MLSRVQTKATEEQTRESLRESWESTREHSQDEMRMLVEMMKMLNLVKQKLLLYLFVV